MVVSDLRYEFLDLIEKKANRLLFEMARLKGKEEAATEELSLRMKFQLIKKKIQTAKDHEGARRPEERRLLGHTGMILLKPQTVGQPDPGGGAGPV